MNKTLVAADLKANLQEQIELAGRIYLLQRAMYEAVINRDWLESEKRLQSIGVLSAKFEELDKKNSVLCKESTADKDGLKKIDFFEAIKDLEKEERALLKGLYDTLKETLYRSKTENDSFSAYISHAQSLVQGMVDIICEQRNGKCYTRTGKRVSVDMTSLVFDKVL